MIRLICLIVAACCGLPAAAQVGQILSAGQLAPGIAGYQGPLDIKPTAVGCWALRSCSNAYATGSNNGADVCDSSTGLTCSTIKIKSDGTFDAATAAASSACAVACKVTKLYDQSGGSLGNVTCSPIATCPVLTFNCLNTTLPCMKFTLGSVQLLKTATIGALNQPLTLSSVINRTAAFTTGQSFFTSDSGTTRGISLQFSSSANVLTIYAGTGTTKAMNDSTLHAVQAMFNGTGSTGATNIDGTDSISLNLGANIALTAWSMGARIDGATPSTLTAAEFIVWNSTETATVRNNLCHNQRLYWGSTGSC